jgi:hypothetical protein
MQASAHLSIGLRHLMAGQRDEAKRSYNSCVACGIFFGSDMDLARAWLVASEGVENDGQLSFWIQRAAKFVGKLPAKEK